MATVQYSKTSPYFGTTMFGNFLDVAADRQIPKDPSDVLYSIDAVYSNRPDLLANDLYSDSSLWWVFAVRNPNVIQDPIFDFTTGTIIYVPKKTTIIDALGL
jgi:hypothetical protein